MELYFETEDLDKTLLLLNNSNIRFLHEIHEEPWGQRTMRFFDPDNHLIEIGEPLHVFIRNMYKNGMTIEEIEKRSGVPQTTIEQLLQ